MKILFTKKSIEKEVRQKINSEIECEFVDVLKIKHRKESPFSLSNKSLIFTSVNGVQSFFENGFMPEEDFTNPLGVYGASKLAGEELALEANPCIIILRTSWVYSEFGKNFVKTMLNLFATREELNVVADQFGQPTNATDLAEAILTIVKTEKKTAGVFNFSNEGKISWCDFAQKIAEISGFNTKINPIETSQYPTPAKRPQNSTLDLSKIKSTYHINIKPWEESLAKTIQLLK